MHTNRQPPSIDATPLPIAVARLEVGVTAWRNHGAESRFQAAVTGRGIT